MGHDHTGGHGHSHAAGTGAGARRRLGIVLAITLTVLLVEVAGAAITGSLALLTDAGHMLVDVLGLGMAFVAAGLVGRPATASMTWGLRRAEVLAAGAQALLLLGVGCYALWEGVQRLGAPPEVPGPLLLVFGAIGLAANIVGLLVLSAGRSESLNMRAAFLEVGADALGSVAVIAAAVAIWLTGWQRADAVAGIVVALLIIPRAALILRSVGRILLESAPPELDLEAVRAHILDRPGVLGVHDLHATLIDSNLPVLTAHVVLDDACFTDGSAPRILADLQSCLAEHFAVSVTHSTFQFEHAGHAATERLDG